MALLWGGYTIGLFGYILVRGYDVTFTDMFKMSWPATKKAAQ
jgi:hypothetical protein